MIAIVDYGMGNVGSIRNMLKRIGAAASVTADPAEIETAERLILPGVGAFDKGMTNLRKSGLLPLLNRKVLEEKVPVLGICLGMQLFAEASEEGIERGLGWIKGKNVRFDHGKVGGSLKIPHMGWNTVIPTHGNSLFRDLEEDHGFYFVHSFHLACDNEGDILARAHHGYDFVAAVEVDNIAGTQFHPEKSHKHGMRILRSFAMTTALC